MAKQSAKYFHTVVLHISPDTEALMGGWVVDRHPLVRKALGCVHGGSPMRCKFIPAGPLRREDWKGHRGPLTAEALRDEGYLSIDCGGGPFDQHVLPDLGDGTAQRTSSLDLLESGIRAGYVRLSIDERIELDAWLEMMRGVFTVVSANDTKGTDVAPSRAAEEKEAVARAQARMAPVVNPTPHVARTLRKAVQGWNLRFPQEPVLTYAWAARAFDGIEANVQMLCAEAAEADLETFNWRTLFRAEELIEGVRMRHADMPDVDANDRAARFADSLEQAYVRMEQEWESAEVAYWSERTRGTTIDMAPQAPSGPSQKAKVRKVTMVFGESRSQLFGAVARRGNAAPVRWIKDRVAGTSTKQVLGDRPRTDRPVRRGADVIIQSYAKGLFVISTSNGIRVERLAAVLREADLIKKGVEITPDIRSQLAAPGNYTYENRSGDRVEAIYLTNYRGAVGNFFRANPYSTPTALTNAEIREITRRVLMTSYREDVSDVAYEIVQQHAERQARRQA